MINVTYKNSFYSVPADFKNPDWNNRERIHDWKNHVKEPIRDIWHTFSSKQKQFLAMCAEENAMTEEWD